jgi:hypothetical protein
LKTNNLGSFSRNRLWFLAQFSLILMSEILNRERGNAMRRREKDLKDHLACLALLYAVKGQIKKSEHLRRIVRRMGHIEQPMPALAG